jgi:hypothetical protein
MDVMYIVEHTQKSYTVYNLSIYPFWRKVSKELEKLMYHHCHICYADKVDSVICLTFKLTLFLPIQPRQ